MRSLRRTGLLLLLALAGASCGGSKERDDLRAYEAAVEDLMAEDGKVTGRLGEIRKDLQAATRSAEGDGDYQKAEAAPFYAKFVAAAAAVKVPQPRLAPVHQALLDYLDARKAYLAASEALSAALRSDAFEKLQSQQGVKQESEKAMLVAMGSGKPDPDVLDAFRVCAGFIQMIFEPYQAGQGSRAEVEKYLNQDVLPRLARVAERTRASLATDDLEGRVARWARDSHAFFTQLGAILPMQEEIKRASTAWEEAWGKGEELRAKYLKALTEYRESLR